MKRWAALWSTVKAQIWDGKTYQAELKSAGSPIVTAVLTEVVKEWLTYMAPCPDTWRASQSLFSTMTLSLGTKGVRHMDRRISLPAVMVAAALALSSGCASTRAIIANVDDPNARAAYESSIGATPLHGCAAFGSVAQVADLLRQGADANARDRLGQTPLFPAVLRGERRVVEELLSHRADVNAKTDQGVTPLHVVASGEKDLKGIMTLLVSRGADVNAVTRQGETPLHLAVRHGHRGSAKVLLDRGANVNAVDISGVSPLYESARRGNTDIAKDLLTKGADHNARSQTGATALHAAGLYGHDGMVKLLLDNGADPNARSTNGSAPLHVAAAAGHRKVVELLLARGANVGATNDDDLTPLGIANKFGQGKIAEVMLKTMPPSEPATGTSVEASKTPAAKEVRQPDDEAEAKQPASLKQPRDASPQSVTQRLEKLKELFDKGLIDEDEYRDERARILKEL
ncbi:ankyrin repeat domain-containing protein [Candidatus Fermentibacteria bacterium]|nr:ankyrin repeat domain-containing protein [Candidatus Fermentibacteria bacterium]